MEDLETGVLWSSRLLYDSCSVANLRFIQLVHRVEWSAIFVHRLCLCITFTRIAAFDFHLILLKVVRICHWPIELHLFVDHKVVGERRLLCDSTFLRLAALAGDNTCVARYHRLSDLGEGG